MEPERITSGLEGLIPSERILTDPAQRASYAFDASFHTRLHQYQPDAVIQVLTANEVAAVVTWCRDHRVPVYPRGAATAQSAGSVPVQGGITLDLTRMDSILEIDAENLQAICEPGVIHGHLNKALVPHKLVFPPDPGSSSMCSLGGMVANNSSGLRAVKYGQTRQYVLGLDVVLPDGRLIETGGVGSRALKSVSGYDLTSLFVGSEGTLGIVTRMRLKVLPLPAKRALTLAAFDDLQAAGRAVQNVFERGILPSAIELLDRHALEAIRLFRPDVELPSVAAVLIFEADGDPVTVSELARQIADACEGLAQDVEWTDDPQRADRMWDARRVAGAAVSRLRPGYTRVYGGEDICVPISAIPAALQGIHDIGARHNIHIAIYGHVGDGNIHTAPIIDMRDEAQVKSAQAMIEKIHELGLGLRGTTTGEHGVGLVRAQYMEREHGPALELMRLLKRTLDPDNLMNPGKMDLDGGQP